MLHSALHGLQTRAQRDGESCSRASMQDVHNNVITRDKGEVVRAVDSPDYRSQGASVSQH